MSDDNNKPPLRKTSDIWFMGYLQNEGYALEDYEVQHPGKSIFHVRISEEDWKKYKLEFHQHKVNKVRRNVESLKDLSFLLLLIVPVINIFGF